MNINTINNNIKPLYGVPAVEIKYSLWNKTFSNTLAPYTEEKQFKGGNDEKRNISVRVKGYHNILELKFDVIGQEAVKSLTGHGDYGDCIAVDKSLFSLITYEPTLEAMSYEILSGVLSHTGEHYNAVVVAKDEADEKYNRGKLRTIFSNNKAEVTRMKCMVRYLQR